VNVFEHGGQPCEKLGPGIARPTRQNDEGIGLGFSGDRWHHRNTNV
jgi:hypothetical protein